MTGTVLVLTLAHVVESGDFTIAGPVLEFFKELALGERSVGAGLLLAYAVASTARAGIWDESPGVAILAVVALVYFSSETLGGSAYLAAFVMGLIVGNMQIFRMRQHQKDEEMLEGFVGQVAEIAILLVFVTLGINLPFGALWEYLLGGLLVMAVFIFVARPLTVLACSYCRTGAANGRETRSPSSAGAATRASSRPLWRAYCLPRASRSRDRCLPRRPGRRCHAPPSGYDRRLVGPQARPDRGASDGNPRLETAFARPKRRYNERRKGATRKEDMAQAIDNHRHSLTQLTDSYDRKMDYLRISVTDRCNFAASTACPRTSSSRTRATS